MTGTGGEWADFLFDVIGFVSVIIFSTGMLQNMVFVVQLYGGAIQLLLRRPRMHDDHLYSLNTSAEAMPVSIIMPAYNEEQNIVASVRSVLSLHYPRIEVIVVNDGSTDDTLRTLIEAFELERVDRFFDNTLPHRKIRDLYSNQRYGNLFIIDKAQGGKADALNAGINISRAPVFCAMDADFILESDSLSRVLQPFVEQPVDTVAVGGTIRIANGCEIRSGKITRVGLPVRIVPLFQVLEYLRAFLIGRLGWSYLGSLMLISGAFGVFSRQVVIDVGGYSTDTVGEDLDLVVKIHRHMHEIGRKYAIRFVPDPVCWTEVPETLSTLARQRMRWQRGAIETFFKHRKMLFNSRYGRAGTLGMSHILVADIVGPPLEALGYFCIPAAWLLGVISWEFMAAYLALTTLFGVFISVCSLALEEMELRRYPRIRDLVILTIVAVVENFGYRQLNNIWRIGGWWQYLRGVQYWNEAQQDSSGTTGEGGPSASNEKQAAGSISRLDRIACAAPHLEQ